MITIFIGENQEKIREIVTGMLNKIGNTNIGIVKEGNTIKVLEKDSLEELVSLKDKIIRLGNSLYDEKKGRLYKSIMEIVEKPLLEDILQRSQGNQLKAAKILGLNRNTIRAKIKKLGINPGIYKE